MNREKTIVRTSIIGVLANVFLAAFKAVIGAITGSIAVTLDAVNNLSDALSSVITILGTRLAGKKPDKKHPYGYGRIEYLTAAIISVIVLYAGVTSLVESVKKILHPEAPNYTAAALVIIAVAVVVKLLLGRYVKGVGEKVKSDSLIASGEDARLDSIISASTLLAAAIYLIFHVSLEAWLGVIISIVIIKSGCEMLMGTLSQILGERADSEVSLGIKNTLCKHPEVYGAYDLILHSYGPDITIGSVHIEVDDTMSAAELDLLERALVEEIIQEHGVVLTGISVYSRNTTDDTVIQLREEIRRTVMAHEHVLQIHGFYMAPEEKTIRFDVVLDFVAPDPKALYQQIVEEVQTLCPGYTLLIALDADLSD